MPTRRQILRATLALPLGTIACTRATRAEAPKGPPSALGYLPWWMAPGWTSFSLGRLDRIVLFDAPIGKEGDLLDREWDKRAPGLQSRAVQRDLALTSFDEAHFDALFGDTARRDRLLTQVRSQLGEEQVSGIHLDIEGYAAARPEAIDAFRRWLYRVDEYRRKLGKTLSGFFPASDRFTPYDREAAQRMDYWVAQIYDAHWPESKTTGPLVTRVPANAVAVPRALARLSDLGVAPGAILLSVPLYGWEWAADAAHPGAATRGRARLLTYAETPQELMPNDRLAASVLARQHGLRRDGEETPYYAYRDGTQWKQGWFEDPRSLTRKLAAERGQGYAGLAFFPLGYDNGEIVDALLDWWAAPR